MNIHSTIFRTDVRRASFVLVAGVVVAVALVAVPPPAHAGTLGLTARIKGAGTVSSVEGGPYSCSKTNNYNDNATSLCDRQAFEAALEAWVWLRPTPADYPSGNSEWRFSTWEGCDQTRVGTGGVTECGVHSGSFTLDERYPKAVFSDARNPSININSGPSQGSRTTSKSATFTFSSDDTLATFRCTLDGAYSPCSSGLTYSSLSEGSHTFLVYAVDPSGNSSFTTIRTWTVDSVAPVLSISAGPADGSTTTSTGATFALSVPEPSQLWCKLDGGSYTVCSGSGVTSGSSPSYTQLSDGPHTFSAYANDGLQNGPVVSRTWTVDTTAPDTTVSGPTGVINDTTPTYSFASIPAGDGAAFHCRLNGAPWQPCSGPGDTHTPTELPDGNYTLEVRATDSAGNSDPSPASTVFEIRTTPPDTVITRGPSSRTTDRTPTFKFTSTLEGSTFMCKLDGARYRACTSPWTTNRLSLGRHTVKVRAATAGIVDPTPAVRQFKVIRRG